MTSAFFYGTLMHPKILKRILKNDASHLKICPSILLDYTRHKVKILFIRTQISQQSCPVNEYYDRLQVLVHPLGPFAPVPVDTTTSGAVEDNLILVDPPPLPAASELAQAVPAQTYVWCLKDNYLNKELWSFDEFIRKNAWKWIKHGADRQGNKDHDS
ncbi:hypothetical protein EDB85DRAFT_1896184 [Lactarius pseudohatsudake]|nr:hypothetical protein EDB85DRAFT_1896184 [Lactarius pseudohatsudake]